MWQPAGRPGLSASASSRSGGRRGASGTRNRAGLRHAAARRSRIRRQRIADRPLQVCSWSCSSDRRCPTGMSSSATCAGRPRPRNSGDLRAVAPIIGARRSRAVATCHATSDERDAEGPGGAAHAARYGRAVLNSACPAGKLRRAPADRRVVGDAFSKNRCALAGTAPFPPQLLEQFDPLVSPPHNVALLAVSDAGRLLRRAVANRCHS